MKGKQSSLVHFVRSFLTLVAAIVKSAVSATVLLNLLCSRPIDAAAPAPYPIPTWHSWSEGLHCRTRLKYLFRDAQTEISQPPLLPFCPFSITVVATSVIFLSATVLRRLFSSV
jgi:hypothetical protein